MNRAGSRFVTVAHGYYRVGGVGERSSKRVPEAREPTPVFQTSTTLVHGGRGPILKFPGTTIKIICYNILATVIHPHELPPPPLPQPKDAPHAVRNHGSVFWPNRTSRRSFGYRWSGKFRPTHPKRTILPRRLLQNIRILHAVAAHNTPSSPPHHRKLPIRHLHSVQLLCFAGTCPIARI